MFAVLAPVGSAVLAQDPEYLSPLARQLSRSDLDEIERVITLKTSQPIVAICGANNRHIPGYRDTLFVATASPARPRDRDIGCYELERTRRGWRIVHGGINPNTSFVSVVRHGP
jgi:hypothetical protein